MPNTNNALFTFRSTPAMDSFMEPIVTRHARARMQQRGIARSHVDFLLKFGREYHDHRPDVDDAGVRGRDAQEQHRVRFCPQRPAGVRLTR